MKVAIVGAGVAGLSIACLLAKEGFDVEIFEAANKCGGKMFQYTNEDGLSWDTGPTLISLPNEIISLFNDLNITVPTLLNVETGCHLNFSDGNNWYLPPGFDEVTKYFSGINSKLKNELHEALQIASAIYNFAERNIFYQDPPNAMALVLKSLSTGLILKFPKLTITPYKKVIDSLFSDMNMKEYFYHFASYVGMNPDEAQGGIISIAHVEFVSPIVFPSNGVYKITERLFEKVLENNIKINLNTEVTSAQLVNEHKISEGWSLNIEKQNTKEKIKKDIIISNCDPFVAAYSWLSNNSIAKEFKDKIENGVYRASESQFVILFDWFDSTEISHHVKIFPKSWRHSFIDVCENYKIPNDPCIYLVWPHATDKKISPRILFISSMAPNNLSGIDWNLEFSYQHAENILNLCRKRMNLKFTGKIFKIITPKELENRAHSFKGGIYSACLKKFNPVTFHNSGITKYKNLFFVGAGVHPGAGVTMVMKSARRIANHIIEAFK